MKIKFSEGKWEEVVDFKSLIDAIVNFVKAILASEYGFEF